MSEYNYDLDLSTDNSNAVIARLLAKNSRVLEFGPAYGRLTKYMKETLGAVIDIVELNETAGQHTAQYANQTFLGAEQGDIEKYHWMKDCKEGIYDAIIFTDVLEHLRNPQAVLEHCVPLLAKGGSILCSVPNTSHASVILSLLAGAFSYTDEGLLDATHQHFFTKSSFLEMADQCDLCATYVHAIRVPVGENEIAFDYTSVNKDIERFLRERADNESYQFVFRLQKKSDGFFAVPQETEAAQTKTAYCYFRESQEENFTPEHCVNVTYQPQGAVTLQFPLEGKGTISSINLNLLDTNCVLRIDQIIAITEAGKRVPISHFDTNGMQFDHFACFPYDSAELAFFMPECASYRALVLQGQFLLHHSDVLDVLGSELFPAINNGWEHKIAQYQAEMQLRGDTLAHCQDTMRMQNEQLLQCQNTMRTQNDQLLQYQDTTRTQSEQLLQCQNSMRVQKEQLLHCKEESRNLETQLAQSEANAREIARQLEGYKNELHTKEENVYWLTRRIEWFQASASWKITAPIRFVGKVFSKIGHGIGRFFFLAYHGCIYLTQNGFKATLKHTKDVAVMEVTNAKAVQDEKAVEMEEEAFVRMEAWIRETPHKFIDIFSVPMGWDTPLFQRFQHLSLQAGKVGGISFYGAHPAVDKDVTICKYVSDTLCIVNLNNPHVVKRFWAMLDAVPGFKYIRLQSIDLATTVEEIESFLRRGYMVVYEYIDEITPQITGKIPEFVLRRHEYLLQNEEIFVVATSDKLLDQIKPYRQKNMMMLCNGVDYDHWHVTRSETPCPQDIQPIVAQGKIIVGYHGALAQWVDYELLQRIAADDRFVLLLIGHEHDGNLKKSGLLDCKNVYFLGARPYQELNAYTAYYDIGILPFVVNEITLSVSPVKIFEYMAAEKPVVTYALPECKKYKSCLCAQTQDEFLELLDEALRLKDDAHYLTQLRRDAQENTWTAITEKMVTHLEVLYQDNLEQKNKVALLNAAIEEKNKNSYLEDLLQSPKYRSRDYRPIVQTPYQRKTNDCKIIAYYLTQFHPDAHNELWWGKGVTEWDNVSRAVPQYPHHYQPRLPGELGFYDLRIEENMARQIELAKMYGVYGFSFYYYWFDGERLLEKPLEAFLENKNLNFPFSLCWANENWTRRFDGTNSGILMQQSDTFESYCNVIHDIARFLQDSRYIEIDGKKLVSVYRPSFMPKAQKVLEYWRDYCREHGYGELYLVAVKEYTVETDWLAKGFDAVSEFHPGTLYANLKNITQEIPFLRKDFGGEVFSYPDIVDHKRYFQYDYKKLYRAVMPMWDNTARRDNKGMIFEGSTPALYKAWLKDVIRAGQQRDDLDDNMIFINAWNEWGEGAYLEPDKRYGYAYLEATKEAVEETRELADS